MKMQAQVTVKDIYLKVKDMDMSKQKHYLVTREGFDKDVVERMELEYKKFIAISVGTPGSIIPISTQVDPMWHTHILFTEDYIDMCKSLGDEYIHHLPAVTDKDAEDLKYSYSNTTMKEYKKSFGEPPEEFWKQNAQICTQCCGRTGSGTIKTETRNRESLFI